MRRHCVQMCGRLCEVSMKRNEEGELGTKEKVREKDLEMDK